MTYERKRGKCSKWSDGQNVKNTEPGEEAAKKNENAGNNETGDEGHKCNSTDQNLQKNS